MADYVGSDGELYEIDDPEVAARNNFRPATKQEVDDYNARKARTEETGRRESLGFGGRLLEDTLETGEGLAAGVVSPLAAGAELIGGQNAFSDWAREARQQSPTAALIGEGLGMLLPGGAAKLGARALGAAAGLATRGLTAAGFAAEAAVGGAIQEFDDSWFEGRDFELKRAAESAAVFGAADLAVGALVKGATRLATRTTAKEGEAVAEKAAKELFQPERESVLSRAFRKLRGEAAPAATEGNTFSTMANATEIDDFAKKAISELSDEQAVAIKENARELREVIAPKAAQDLDAVVSSFGDELGTAEVGELYRAMARDLSPEKVLKGEAGLKDVALHLSEYRARLVGEDGAGLFGPTGDVVRRGVDESLQAMAQAKNFGDRYVAADNAKRWLDMADQLLGEQRRATPGAVIEVQELNRKAADTVRSLLEDSNAFGQMGAFQREKNAIWHETLIPAMNELQNAGIVRLDRLNKQYGERGFSRLVFRVTAEGLERFTANSGVGQHEARKAIDALLSGTRQMGDLFSATGLTSSTLDTQLKGVVSAVSGLRKSWRVGDLIAAAEARAPAPSVFSTMGAQAGQWGAAKLGGLAGGPLGGMMAALGANAAASLGKTGKRIKAAGGAFQMLDDALRRSASEVDPFTAARMSPQMQASLGARGADVLESATAPSPVTGSTPPSIFARAAELPPSAEQGVANLLAERAASYLDGGDGDSDRAPASPRVAAREQLKAIARATDDMLTVQAKRLLSGDAPARTSNPLRVLTGAGAFKPSEGVAAVREVMRELRRDPMTFLEALRSVQGGVGLTHPRLESALTAKAADLFGYLHQELPITPGVTALRPEGYPVSYASAYDYGMKVAGAADPIGTIHAIATGSAHPLQVTAFKQNWPSLFLGLAEKTVLELRRANEAGETIPPERMRRIDQLLELDGKGDVLYSWTTAETMELAKNQLQQQQRAPSRMTTTGASLADNFATRRAARRYS